MLRQNIEHFLKKRIYEKLVFPEMSQVKYIYFCSISNGLYSLYL